MPMLYRPYGSTNKMISAIGFGSTRFNSADLNDEAGLQRCAELVCLASEQGVNYFDIAGNYAKSQCEQIYKIAFKQMKNPYFITNKSSSFQDNTAEDVLRRIDGALTNMDVEKIHFFYMWSIMNEDHYRDIMKKGGAYEGALRAKEMGLVEHIVCSNHASPEVALKIIKDGYFEGITLSYNILNDKLMAPVLKAAGKKQMGVTVMNPLAGGMIPQNEAFFSTILQPDEKSVTQAALRFIYANPEVTSILSGIRRAEELFDNIEALSDTQKLTPEYGDAIKQKINAMTGFCTGCGYCRGVCPQQIPIPEYMQSYNMVYFDSGNSMYGRTEPELIKRISILRKLEMDFQKTPEHLENPCVGCQQCERICTQHLKIIEKIEMLYQMLGVSGATLDQYRQRLDERLHSKGYKKVAFYTAGGYTAKVIDLYTRFFGAPDFEVMIFDSNESRWGDLVSGYPVYDPKEIPLRRPECIIISNYIYDSEIYQTLAGYEQMGIKVVKLHEADDVPWVY